MEPAETTSPQINSLLNAMKRESRKARMLRHLRFGIAFVWLATLPVYFLLARRFGWHGNLGIVNFILSSLNMIVHIIAVYINSEKRTRLVKQIADIEDKQACGAMADVLGFEDFQIHQVAKDALKILLPRLQASDAGALNTTQRQHLHRLLKQKDTELALVVLRALQQVGDMRDWNAVQSVAEGKTRGKTPLSPNVVHAAQECLPFLQANAERQEIRHTLLRASDRQTETSPILLRPADNSVTEPSQLLRPHDSSVRLS